MDFGRISRRHLLQGGTALTLGTALGPRSALAADTTIGFIYVGSRDDYGYNQAHAQGAAALKKMPGLKVVEDEKVPETDAIEKTMGSMINLDGATLLFPTSFGYYNPHVSEATNRPAYGGALTRVLASSSCRLHDGRREQHFEHDHLRT
jgi:basic membrane protein A